MAMTEITAVCFTVCVWMCRCVQQSGLVISLPCLQRRHSSFSGHNTKVECMWHHLDFSPSCCRQSVNLFALVTSANLLLPLLYLKGFFVFIQILLNGLSEDYFPYESLIRPIKGIQLNENSYPKLLLVSNIFQVLCLWQEESLQDFVPGWAWCQPCHKAKWNFL